MVDKFLGFQIPGGTKGIIHTFVYNFVGAVIAATIWFD